MNEYLPWAWLGHIPRLDFDGDFFRGVIDACAVLLGERGGGHYE